MELIFATNNSHKITEIQGILGTWITLKNLNDIKCTEDIPETGSTLEANATQKSFYIYNRYHVNCFADDTGLEVEALNGAPGVYSARYAGEQRNASDNMCKLLNDLGDEKNRKAQFRTVISLIINGTEYQFEGVVEGHITSTQSGSKGFGYDPVFVPEGYDITMAEMDLHEKNKISHRASAIKKMVQFLNQS